MTSSYGSWRSPISSDDVALAGFGLSQLRVHGDETYWLESRPIEDGRRILVRRRGGETADVTPSSFDVRSRVHEYGGGDYVVTPHAVYCSSQADQNLYRCSPDGPPVPLTRAGNLRFADGVYAFHDTLFVVCEDHATAAPDNYLARVDLPTGDVSRLVSGADFFAYPRLSPDGRTLAWISWNRPHMPWDGSELWTGAVDRRGAVGERRRVAGGIGQSVYQPEWSPDGVLHYVSDADGWWNLYRWRGTYSQPVLKVPGECGEPLWTLGSATYGFAADGVILCRYVDRGIWHLGVIDPRNGRLRRMDLPYSALSDLRVDRQRAVVIAGGPGTPMAVVQIDLPAGTHLVLATDRSVSLDHRHVSIPEPIEFPTTAGDAAYAFFYRPRNDDAESSPGERPPLIVKVHGGPTGAATTALNLNTQFWTSRGFAVVDVNYRGSSGYGSGYRRRLRGQWGVFDVDDAAGAAAALVQRGLADPTRMAIRGKSAGGFTALCAVAFRRVFHGATSLNGISDLEALLETHKFESGYLSWLIGPYPEARERYRARSPLWSADDIHVPVLLIQGRRDVVVSASQSERLAAILERAGKPVRVLVFGQEGHGFRRRETIREALDAELAFMAAIVARTAIRR